MRQIKTEGRSYVRIRSRYLNHKFHQLRSAVPTGHQHLHQEFGTATPNIPRKASVGLAPSIGMSCNLKVQLRWLPVVELARFVPVPVEDGQQKPVAPSWPPLQPHLPCSSLAF
jgi:hypothetical protein